MGATALVAAVAADRTRLPELLAHLRGAELHLSVSPPRDGEVALRTRTVHDVPLVVVHSSAEAAAAAGEDSCPAVPAAVFAGSLPPGVGLLVDPGTADLVLSPAHLRDLATPLS